MFTSIERVWKNIQIFRLNVFFGLITDFFDTLGIGNFAPTTALFKAFGQVRDRVLLGTLNVSHTAPVILGALMTVAWYWVSIRSALLGVSSLARGKVPLSWPRHSGGRRFSPDRWLHFHFFPFSRSFSKSGRGSQWDFFSIRVRALSSARHHPLDFWRLSAGQGLTHAR